MISLHQLSKGLLSRCYCDSARVAESDSSSNMHTTGGLSTRATESPPQAQQEFAEPILATNVQHTDSVDNDWVLLTLTWLRDSTKKVAESGSWHMAQGISEEGGWVWLLTHGSGTQWKRWLSLALDTQLKDSAKKVAESGSWHRTWSGPQRLSVGQDWVGTEKGKRLTCWASWFQTAWILVSLMSHQTKGSPSL